MVIESVCSADGTEVCVVCRPLTLRQGQARIRRHWSEYMLEFRTDGQLWAKPRQLNATWDVLLPRTELSSLLAIACGGRGPLMAAKVSP